MIGLLLTLKISTLYYDNKNSRYLDTSVAYLCSVTPVSKLTHMIITHIKHNFIFYCELLLLTLLFGAPFLCLVYALD